MTNRDKSTITKASFRNNKTFHLVILVASLVLPIISLMNATGLADSEFFVFYNWLWIGFYSSLLTILFVPKKKYHIVLLVINIVILIFGLVTSLLAGLNGLLFMIIKMLVPLIPDDWIGIELQP